MQKVGNKLVIGLVIFGAVFGFLGILGPNEIEAGPQAPDDNSSGYVWSENIGWLRFRGPLMDKTGLVGGYFMDETNVTTGTIINDESSQGNNGTYQAGAGDTAEKSVAGKYGKALYFDGENDYVYHSGITGMETLSAVTLELWFKAAPSLVNAGLITFHGSSVDQLKTRLFIKADGKALFQTVTGSSKQISSNSDVTDDNWHHLVGTYDKNAGANNQKMYVDGVLQTAKETNTGDISDIASAYIGRYSTVYYYDGIIDEVRIYNRALTGPATNCTDDPDNEVCAHYKGYGVNINGNGEFSGDAWAENIGWVSFDRAKTGTPPGPPYNGNEAYIAKMDGTNVTGWARALAGCKDNLWNGTQCTGSGAGDKAGGWSGWIKMRGPLMDKTGLVGGYFMDKAHVTTGTIINDESSQGNNGTYQAGDGDTAEKSVTGKYGKALSFDGENDYVEAADNASLHLTKGSIEFWFKPTGGHSSGDAQKAIIGKEGSGSNVGDFDIRLGDDGKLHFYLDDGTGNPKIDSNSSSWNEQWYHVVCTFDSTPQQKMYVDGVLQTQTGSIVGNATRADKLYIGGLRSATLFPFPGSIDEVRIYNRALTGPATNCTDDPDNEICAHYKGYGVSLNTTAGGFEGYAWGGNISDSQNKGNVGWIHFNGDTYQAKTTYSSITVSGLSDSWPAPCSQSRIPTLSWNVSDSDPPYDYEIEIYDNAQCDGTPKITGSGSNIASGSMSWSPSCTKCCSEHQNDILWNTPYYWRVRAKQHGGETWSGWVKDTDGFTTHLHCYPAPSFKCSFDNINWYNCNSLPHQPSVNEKLYLKDTSTCYNTDNSFYAASDCYNATCEAGTNVTTYTWDFPSNTIFDNTISPLNNVTFQNGGTQTITMTVVDKHSPDQSCDCEQEVDVSLPLPGWKEVSPF